MSYFDENNKIYSNRNKFMGDRSVLEPDLKHFVNSDTFIILEDSEKKIFSYHIIYDKM